MPQPEGNDAGGSGENAEQGQGLVFESWFTEQPGEVQSLLDGHERGLKSALESERETRKQLEKQMKELLGKAEKGSELERQLNELVQVQTQAEARATFYEEAHAAGITNLKLAWLVAGSDGFIDSKGRVNFGEMKTRYPELFSGTRTAPGNAGTGTNQTAMDHVSMDDFIRRKINR